jgi:hypothetical protein
MPLCECGGCGIRRLHLVDTGGVLVSRGDGAARGAGIRSFGKRQCVLGSRSALGAVHRGVRRVDQMHGPAMLPRHLHQRLLRGADRRVGGLAGHGGLREELGPKVLHSERVVFADDLLGPLTGRVLPLGGDFPVQFRRLPLRFTVALRGGLPLGRTAPGHHPLVAGKLVRGCPAMLRVGKAVGGGCGGGRLFDAPVDPDHAPGRGQGLGQGRDDEGCPPVPHRIPVQACVQCRER